MNLLPKSREDFSDKEYWNAFFKKRGNKAFEWYGEYPELCEHLHKYIKIKDDVLIVGCGNSSLGSDLYDIGYSKITNIDISQVVIKQMLNLHAKQRPLMKFIHMDALNTSFDDGTFSVVLDKGTLDALMSDDSPQAVRSINKYFDEIKRILKIGGRYVCISLLQEHILKTLLEYFPSNDCMFRVVRCYEAEKKAAEADESALPVFIVVCTKFNALPTKVLEINLGACDKMQRLENIDEVTAMITSVQKAAFVCSGLQRNSIADQNEVSFDLHRPGDASPRFTLHVVDISDRKNAQYAAFVVPQGRESEWLFATNDGRKNLVKITQHNRLAIVTMHRGQSYENLDAVRGELNDIVRNLAPAGVHSKIPFLSVGSDVGSRVIRYEGRSKFSGNYVVEDVEVDGSKFRRLYYLDSQLVIQSEAQLKSAKNRKGNVKDIVNHAYLTCQHHVCMSIATYLACEAKTSPSVAIVGLGGGGLCSFMHKFIPKATIKAVDIDEDMMKVATEWFGLTQDEKLQIEIIDGIKFLENCTTQGNKYDAILFDVDSKDSTIGMSCPPKQFLDYSVIDNVKNSLETTGLFILNMVIRDQTLRAPILNDLKKKFNHVTTYKLGEDLNEIVICADHPTSKSDTTSKYKNACNQINKFFKRNNLPNDKLVAVDEFVTGLEGYE